MEKKARYCIKVEDRNPEGGTWKKPEVNTYEVDGFLLVGFGEDEPLFEAISGISVDNIKDYILKETEVSTRLRMAAALAEGYRKAWEISESFKKQKTRKQLEKFEDRLRSSIDGEE